MKRVILPIIILIILTVSVQPLLSEVVEKIYAVVNGELITYSELRGAQREMTRILSQQYKGEELVKEVEKMKKDLLDRLIDQKVVLSFAREKNYDVSGDVDMIIKNIKQENNLKTDEELQQAIQSQGMDFQQWKKQVAENRIQQRYIYQEIGAKINIDNAHIMEYYRANMKEFTEPANFTLHCIFLDKNNYTSEEALHDKKVQVLNALKDRTFIDVAKIFSELPGETNYVLGSFKEGELDAKIEGAAKNLQKGQNSDWIETDTGWYIIHLVEYTAPKLTEYKKVRANIENILRNKEQDAKMADFIEELKKQSHIKIYAKE